MKTNKEPVRLREKKLKNGNVSLYLDIYFGGVRKYEMLRLYLIPERTRADKEANRSTLAIANSIKAKRILDIQSGAYDVKLANRAEELFFPYYDKRAATTKGGSHRSWMSMRRILADYCGNEDITFRQMGIEWAHGLRDYIDNKSYGSGVRKIKTITDEELREREEKGLAHGTKCQYWTIIKTIFNEAVREGVIDKSPFANIAGFKPSDPKRTYLTAEEVRILSQTPCKRQDIKNAFLFSCLTGLRHSDIESLTWGDVREENGYTRITFRQRKTRWLEYLDLNRQAVALMGERKEDSAHVFPIGVSLVRLCVILKDWAEKAKINKHVTFHVARHTFATMMLNNGVDLYTVSKLVGHKNINTTQIYAKVMDENKRKAVDTIPDGILG